MQPPGASPEEPPATGKPAPAEPVVSPRAASPDTTGLAKADVEVLTKAAVKAELAGPLAELTSAMAKLTETQKSLAESNALAGLRSITGSPRSQPNDGPPPAAPKKITQAWPSDMSSEVKKNRAAAAAK
jgi:hypothetical protein